MPKKIVLRTNIKREKNNLYFCGTDEAGNIMLCKTEMVHGKKGKAKKKDG